MIRYICCRFGTNGTVWVSASRRCRCGADNTVMARSAAACGCAAVEAAVAVMPHALSSGTRSPARGPARAGTLRPGTSGAEPKTKTRRYGWVQLPMYVPT